MVAAVKTTNILQKLHLYSSNPIWGGAHTVHIRRTGAAGPPLLVVFFSFKTKPKEDIMVCKAHYINSISMSVLFLIFASTDISACDKTTGQLQCTNDMNSCLGNIFYPCGNNASWTFDFSTTVNGPRNTVLLVKLQSTGLETRINANQYPAGYYRYHLAGGPNPMIQTWERLWITRWSGQGGDFIEMELNTSYSTGNPTRPEGP